MQIPKGKVISRTSAPDPWYGNNITEIIEGDDGRHWRVSYSDGHERGDQWTSVKEVKPVQTTEWVEL